MDMRSLSVFCLLYSLANSIHVGEVRQTASLKSVSTQPSPLDDWTSLLQKHIKPQLSANGIRYNQVNYTGLAEDNVKLDAVIAALTTTNVVALNKSEALSMYMNAYNALAIRTVLRAPCFRTVLRCSPITSINQIGSGLLTGHRGDVWKQTAGIIGGRKRSLQQIQDFLRNPAPKFVADPRIHAGVNTASISSPDLQTQAFVPAMMDKQLDVRMRALMADEHKGFRLDRKAQKVTLSRLFKWFKGDFAPHGGALRFVLPYVDEADRRYIEAHNSTISLDYFDFDWDLNGRAPCDCDTQATTGEIELIERHALQADLQV